MRRSKGLSCTKCDANLTIDETNPPNDDEIYFCPSCGVEIGRFGAIRKAAIEEAKRQANVLARKGFGKEIRW